MKNLVEYSIDDQLIIISVAKKLQNEENKSKIICEVLLDACDDPNDEVIFNISSVARLIIAANFDEIYVKIMEEILKLRRIKSKWNGVKSQYYSLNKIAKNINSYDEIMRELDVDDIHMLALHNEQLRKYLIKSLYKNNMSSCIGEHIYKLLETVVTYYGSKDLMEFDFENYKLDTVPNLKAEDDERDRFELIYEELDDYDIEEGSHELED